MSLILALIDFELDAKRVVDSCLSPRHDVNEFGFIVQNCNTFFRQFYENSSVEFVQRQINGVAHNLAKAISSSTSF